MKECFKCKIVKPLDDYYKHKQMSDGHLNKCKSCTRQDSKEREEILRKDPIWIEKEKARSREKYHRLGYKELHKPSFEDKKRAMNLHRSLYPEKYKARILSQRIPILKGNARHHWSYNIEHAKDIIELTISDHAKLHRYIIYDQERFMYRRCDNMQLLDTKEKHLEYFESIKSLP